MERRLALLICSSQFQDSGLSSLKTPEVDIAEFGRILADPKVGGFEDVNVLSNEPSHVIREAISEFFHEKKRNDLLLLYFSGHGLLDDNGRLYLAATDTKRQFLRARAISAQYITDEMDNCRSRRQVLILDCCHSGAFSRGSKGVRGAKVGVGTAFEGMGYGKVILTASDATQFAWEGDHPTGEASCSVFTNYLIEGLKTGGADLLEDGRITIDELYDYAYEKIMHQASDKRQTPGKWSYHQEGEIVIASNPNPKAHMKRKLPKELVDAMENPISSIRLGVVEALGQFLDQPDKELSDMATAALIKLQDDDSRRVSEAAKALLDQSTEIRRDQSFEVTQESPTSQESLRIKTPPPTKSQPKRPVPPPKPYAIKLPIINVPKPSKPVQPPKTVYDPKQNSHPKPQTPEKQGKAIEDLQASWKHFMSYLKKISKK